MSGESMSVEDALRADLARADSIIASTRPVLRLLLAEGEQALFSDQVVARIRGMLAHCAGQLLAELAADAAIADRGAFLARHQAPLATSLLHHTALLSHAQALALEALRAERLQQRSGIDPVLPPLIQEACAAPDEQVASLAMQVLAAQARFLQHQRRMELPLGELPGDLFHQALLAMRGIEAVGEDVTARCEARLRRQFDDGERRVNRMSRLVLALGQRPDRALALGHAGLGMFVSALALATAQDRDLAVLSLGENQLVRLALSLRAAGLEPAAVGEQLVTLNPDARLPGGIEHLQPDRAADLLGATLARTTGAAEHG